MLETVYSYDDMNRYINYTHPLIIDISTTKNHSEIGGIPSGFIKYVNGGSHAQQKFSRNLHSVWIFQLAMFDHR